MAKISPYAFWMQLDDNGDPLAGGKLFTYEAGTSTNKQTFTSQDESALNTNPVILDASGRADVWLDTGAYKLVLKDANDVEVDTVDDIIGGSSDAYGGAVVDVTANRPVTEADQNLILNCVGTLTLSLLDVATAEEGFLFVVRNSGSGVVTLDPDGAETIDGSATKAIQAEGSVNVVVDDNGAWITTNENYGTTNAEDMTFTGDNTFIGLTAFKDAGELTIATGVITATGANHTVDTESDASSDDLITINGGADGEILTIRAENTARTVVVKDGSGNIEIGADFSLDDTEKKITLMYDLALTKWLRWDSLAVSGLLKSVQVFTATGTWTKPAGIALVQVAVGGGGGGGGYNRGGGGGAGGVARELIDVTGTASETITIGAGGAGGTVSGTPGVTGGTSSFGSFCSATGGTGGFSDSTSPVRAGGVGGTATGGDINTTGGGGENAEADFAIGGHGGSTAYGGGGGNSDIVGNAGQNGGGGSGGGATDNGGAGGAGVIIVYEYS